MTGGRKSWDHGGKSRNARGYGREWEKLREQALLRGKHLCQPCLRDGRVTPAHAVDHIIPKARGGTDDLANLQAICRACHLHKSLRDQGRRRRPRIGLDGWPVK